MARFPRALRLIDLEGARWRDGSPPNHAEKKIGIEPVAGNRARLIQTGDISHTNWVVEKTLARALPGGRRRHARVAFPQPPSMSQRAPSMRPAGHEMTAASTTTKLSLTLCRAVVIAAAMLCLPCRS